MEPLRIFMQLAIESARQEKDFGCLRFTILFDVFYARDDDMARNLSNISMQNCNCENTN